MLLHIQKALSVFNCWIKNDINLVKVIVNWNYLITTYTYWNNNVVAVVAGMFLSTTKYSTFKQAILFCFTGSTHKNELKYFLRLIRPTLCWHPTAREQVCHKQLTKNKSAHPPHTYTLLYTYYAVTLNVLNVANVRYYVDTRKSFFYCRYTKTKNKDNTYLSRYNGKSWTWAVWSWNSECQDLPLRCI